MLLELLILASGGDRGKIVHFQPSPALWGRKERPPVFAIVPARLPAAIEPRACRWDFDAEQLVGPDGAAVAGREPAKDYHVRDILTTLLEEAPE